MRRENLVRDSGCPVAETRLPTGRLTVRAPPLSGGETTTLAQVEPVVVLILAAVFIGALAQRITGMGFGLVSGPFLVLLLDPVSGVLLVNLCGIVAAATVFARTWREVEWPVFWKLAVGTVVGTVPGALLTTALPTASLQVLIGALIIASLAVSLLIGRVGTTMPANFGTQFSAGFVSGTMSAAAGAGGPAVSAYAVLTRWEHRPFAATLQPFLVVGTASAIIAKVIVDGGVWPQLDPAIWIGIGIVLVAGLLGGDLLAQKVAPTAARIAMIVLAFGGGAATLAKGLGLFG